MKKGIILVIIVLCVLSISACSKKKELDVFTMMQKSDDCFFRKKGDNKTYYWMGGHKFLIVEESLVHESEDGYMAAEWEYEFDYYLGGNKMIIVFVYPSDYIRINGKLYAMNSDVSADGIYKKAETIYSIIQNHPDEYECPTYSYPKTPNGS